MQLGGNARYFVEIESSSELIKAVDYARANNLKFKVIGGGSNLIATDEGYHGLIIANRIRGISIEENDDGTVVISAGAGENWDSLVEHSVSLGLTGIEALSLIPGSVGATPIQNVGAYGQDVSQTITEAEVVDTSTNEVMIFDNESCGFEYRYSIFKGAEKDRFAIISVSFRLRRGTIEPPLYRALEGYLAENSIEDLSPATIRRAVIAIRMSKLPDPKVLANTGSFFKNPMISQQHFNELKDNYPEIPGFEAGPQIKVPAGWLLESCGFKNYHHDNGMGTHENHALVLVNRSASSYKDLAELRSEIKQAVEQKFDIELEQEPETLEP